MRGCEFWVALPDTLFTDVRSLREKTVKTGLIGRACAVFGVTGIYLYRDAGSKVKGEGELITHILNYLDAPQYLRRRLYPRREELTYAGLLPPLRAPHHTVPSDIRQVRVGDYREGVVMEATGRLVVDVGLPRLALLDGRAHKGRRLTVQMTSIQPEVKCRAASKQEVKQYWGYEVRAAPSLGRLVEGLNMDVNILTSRKGKPIEALWEAVAKEIGRSRNALVAFGSARRGLYEILGDEGLSPNGLTPYTLNLFPHQGTATVRTEEALFGALAILNLAKSLSTRD